MSEATASSPPLPADPARRRAAGWLAAGLFALPFLAHLEWDFERGAALVVLAPTLAAAPAVLARGLARFLHLPPRRRICAIFVLLLVGLATIHSDQPAASVVLLAEWTILLLGAVLAGQIVAEEPSLAHRLLAGLALGAAGATLCHWANWRLGAPPLAAFYPHHRLMGLHLLGGALAATALWATAAGSGPLWPAVAIVTWGGLLWTGSRAPLLAVLVALGFWWLRASASGRRRLLIAGACSLAGGLMLSWLLDAHNPELGWIRSVQRTVHVGTAKELTSNRTDFWRSALTRAIERPLLGRGPDAYRYLEPKLEGAQPHNVELQVLLDLGAPAGIGLLLFAALALQRGRRRLPADAPAAGWAALAVASLLAGQLDGFFYHALALVPAALALGISGGAAAPGPAAAPGAVPRWARAWPVPAGAAAAVLVVHLVLFFAVARAQPPAPDSAVARLWRAFPSTTLGLERWIGAWERISPDAALALARDASAHSPNGDFFHVEAAGILQRRGDRAGALEEMDAALLIAPWQMRDTITALRRQMAAPAPAK